MMSTRKGLPIIAMELLGDQTLKHSIEGKPLRTEQLLEVGTKIRDALDAAYPQGILHLDIKTAYVLVTQRGQVKILDFVGEEYWILFANIPAGSSQLLGC
jgi:serine/threonine protein kinase